jgi:hypothetical protein
MVKSESQLTQELHRAIEGLLFMSESDYPFQVIEWEQQIEITPDYLRRQTAGASPQTPVRTQGIDDFFRAASSEPSWKQGAELDTARKYQSLVQLLKESLSELMVYRVGEVSITIYILGKSETGSWQGLTTQVVET